MTLPIGLSQAGHVLDKDRSSSRGYADVRESELNDLIYREWLLQFLLLSMVFPVQFWSLLVLYKCRQMPLCSALVSSPLFASPNHLSFFFKYTLPGQAFLYSSLLRKPPNLL